MKNNKETFKLKSIILSHISNNSKEYIVMLLLFVIGIFLGVLFINNIQEEQFNNISQYINNFIEKLKNVQNLDKLALLKSSILENIILATIIWFFGTTVIGIPIVFGLVIYRGFCLGYTISSCICVLGTSKGIAFILSNLLLQNIIFIPALLAIAVSGFKLYKSIMKDKRRENMKLEIIRHTIFSALMAVLLSLASLIQVFISDNILKLVIKYF